MSPAPSEREPGSPEAVSGARAGADTGPTQDPDAGVRCDLCGGPMLDRHCKLVCRTCGYQRDCSDP